MQGNVRNNICFLAEHTHFFHFHTPEAKKLKREIQDWWTAEKPDDSQADTLLSRFLTLSGANPVAAACGWYQDADKMNSRKMQWLNRRMGDCKHYGISRADIYPQCPQGCYIPQRGCFLGMLPQDQQKEAQIKYLDDCAAQVSAGIEKTKQQVTDQISYVRTREYGLLFTKEDNFTWFKGLVHTLSLGLAIYLAPQWFRVLWTFLYTLFTGSFDVERAYYTMMQLPVANRMPLYLLLMMMVFVTIVLLCFRRSVWEAYFGLYRSVICSLMRHRFRRVRRRLRRLAKAPAKYKQRLLKRSYNWKRMKRQRYTSLTFPMPQWVKIDINPCFRFSYGWKTFPLTLQTFPSVGRKGGGRSRTKGATFWRLLMCAVLLLITWTLR